MEVQPGPQINSLRQSARGLRTDDTPKLQPRKLNLSKKSQKPEKKSMVTWCIILLEVAIRGWVHDGDHKWMDMVSNNTQVGRDI